MSDLKYEEFVLHHFEVKTRYGNEAMVRCIEHDDHSASMQVNLESGLWLCFSCGARGGPRQLFESFGIPFDQTAVDLDLSGVIKTLDALNRQARSRKPAETVHIYPESYLDQFDIPTDYWETRGFTQRTVERFKFGFSPLGNFVTLPMRDMHGRLLGVTRRYMNIEDSPTGDRYKYPAGFQRKENLYASWLVAEDERASTVAMTEGALDCAKVWQAGHPAVAVYGSSVSSHQIRELLRCNVREVVMFFDNDVAGRKVAKGCLGWKTNKRKGVVTTTYDPESDLRNYVDVRTVVWPKKPYPSVQDKRMAASDPGDLDSAAIKEMLRYTVEPD